MTATQARTALRRYASARKAKILSRFFKTGPGEYGEGDVFIGVKVPETRKVAKEFAGLALDGTLELLHSEIHEERLLSLFLLIKKYEKGNSEQKKQIVELYLKNTPCINNWDLVDLSAPKILGHWMLSNAVLETGPGPGTSDASLHRGTRRSTPPHTGGMELLDTLARSSDLWERRIAIISTLAFIRNRNFTNTFRIADRLLNAPEDLLHKAVGWMLREVGKRDVQALEDFLRPRYKTMPRTMLRYSIEKFSEAKRRDYLKGKA